MKFNYPQMTTSRIKNWPNFKTQKILCPSCFKRFSSQKWRWHKLTLVEFKPGEFICSKTNKVKL